MSRAAFPAGINITNKVTYTVNGMYLCISVDVSDSTQMTQTDTDLHRLIKAALCPSVLSVCYKMQTEMRSTGQVAGFVEEYKKMRRNGFFRIC